MPKGFVCFLPVISLSITVFFIMFHRTYSEIISSGLLSERFGNTVSWIFDCISSVCQLRVSAASSQLLSLGCFNWASHQNKIPKLPILCPNFQEDFFIFEICLRMVSPPTHCTEKSSLSECGCAELLNESHIHLQKHFTCGKSSFIFGSSTEEWNMILNWKTDAYKGESSSPFTNRDVNQEYAFDSQWCSTAPRRESGPGQRAGMLPSWSSIGLIPALKSYRNPHLSVYQLTTTDA